MRWAVGQRAASGAHYSRVMSTEPRVAPPATSVARGVARAGDDTVAAASATARVVLYSDDSSTREAVRRAVGRRASKDTPRVDWLEVATPDAMFAAVAAGGVDLLVLDGETAKVGGFGLAREIKDSYFDAPPVLLLVARAQDAWIAAWSQADATVPYPLKPMEVADTVAGLLRARTSA